MLVSNQNKRAESNEVFKIVSNSSLECEIENKTKHHERQFLVVTKKFIKILINLVKLNLNSFLVKASICFLLCLILGNKLTDFAIQGNFVNYFKIIFFLY